MTEEKTNETKVQKKSSTPKEVAVIALRKFFVADENSSRGINVRTPTGTGTRPIEKGAEATIDIELARKLQDAGAIKIKL